MAKFEVTKTVEAVKLNKRTGIPLTEHPITLPYGAIIDDLEESGDYFKFAYLSDRYQMKQDAVKGALQPIGSHAPAAAAITPAAAAPAASAPVTSGPVLSFEPLRVSGATPLSRAKIPGGWLVTNSGGIAFIPDPGHAWDGSN